MQNLSKLLGGHRIVVVPPFKTFSKSVRICKSKVGKRNLLVYKHTGYGEILEDNQVLHNKINNVFHMNQFTYQRFLKEIPNEKRLPSFTR